MKKSSLPAISISVNGGKEVSLTGVEFDQLPRMISGRKIGPMTKAQADAAALIATAVRRGMGLTPSGTRTEEPAGGADAGN